MTGLATTPVAAPPAVAGPRSRGKGFRPEIQGLRAVAVLLVVAFHLYPNRVAGGYVGVDVFFVISGFLITAHIHRELVSTGSVSLRRFWARRIRRLLPASLLVLAVTGVAVVALVPATVWSSTARQIGASALYVQNWVLAGDAVDYMAADNIPTAVQHYWSLSVEEQFYFVWPALLLGLALLHRRSGSAARAQRRYLIGGLVVLVGASFVWSVLATARDQASAYFITPTRAWEFGAGALLALAGAERLRGDRWRGLAGWAGLVAIVVAGLAFSSASLFPGWIALLPVLGTVAVIAAGSSGGRWAPAWWLSLAPMRFIGDVSYSVYLWHWPLIIVWPYVTGVGLRTRDKLAIVVATVLLAWASKAWVEDPARVRPLLAAAPWRSYAFAVVGMSVVVAGAAGVLAEVDRRADAAAVQRAAAIASDCYGPHALDPGSGCEPPEGNGELIPPPEVVAMQNQEPLYPGCQAGITSTALRTCELGVPRLGAERVVALVGDSHATQWFPAFDQLGQELGWHVVTYAKSSCPFTQAQRVLESEQTDEAMLSCVAWRDGVREQLLADEDISYVFTAAFSSAYGFTDSVDDPVSDPGTDGFEAIWADLVADGHEVFALSEVPLTQGDNVPNCLAAHPGDRMACAVPRETAVPRSLLSEAVRDMADPDVHLINLIPQLCDDETCYPVVGDVIVFRDYSHLSADYVAALVPYLRDRIAQVAGS